MTVRLAIALLAAGYSRRFGASNKLLAPLGNTTVIEHSLSQFEGLAAHRRILIHGEESFDAQRSAGWEKVCNKSPSTGLSSSLHCALAFAADCDWLLVALGDMPFVTQSTIKALLDAAEGASAWAIAPCYKGGRPGLPVLWHRSSFDALNAVKGDKGGRALLQNNTHLVAVDDPGIYQDIDTKDDLKIHLSVHQSLP